jgi:hypothetical protein
MRGVGGYLVAKLVRSYFCALTSGSWRRRCCGEGDQLIYHKLTLDTVVP